MHSSEKTSTLSFPLSRTLASQPLASVESLCSSCRYDEEHYPTTTAANSRSNNINKDISRTRQGALDGCWICAVLLAATGLWNLSLQQEKETINFSVRYDAERFTLRGRSILPILQVYSVGAKTPWPSTIADEPLFLLTSIIQENPKYCGSSPIPSYRLLQPHQSLPNSLHIT